MPYTELVFRPMLELFELLEANAFRLFVCSDGGRDLMRVIAESAWDIPREHVIGTARTYRYEDGLIRRGGEVHPARRHDARAGQGTTGT